MPLFLVAAGLRLKFRDPGCFRKASASKKLCGSREPLLQFFPLMKVEPLWGGRD